MVNVRTYCISKQNYWVMIGGSSCGSCGGGALWVLHRELSNSKGAVRLHSCKLIYQNDRVSDDDSFRPLRSLQNQASQVRDYSSLLLSHGRLSWRLTFRFGIRRRWLIFGLQRSSSELNRARSDSEASFRSVGSAGLAFGPSAGGAGQSNGSADSEMTHR